MTRTNTNGRLLGRALPHVQLAAIAAIAISAPACKTAGWLANAVGGGPKKVEVEAQYRGLENSQVAVLVAAPDTTLYQHPRAPQMVGRAVTARIAARVQGAVVSDPDQIAAFQRQNAAWTGVPPTQLFERLAVDRIVMVDLAEYSTHEPGNAHVFRGVVVGKVGVFAADSEDPNSFAYSQLVSSHYPPGGGLGLLEDDAATIELGMLNQFAERAAGLFYDHTVVQEE